MKTKRLLEGGFKLRKSKTNDEELLKEIQKRQSEEKQGKFGQEDLSNAKENLGPTKDLEGARQRF